MVQRYPFGRCLAVFVTLGLAIGLAVPAMGLTTYRIGGESLPPPEVEGDFEFVQLSWSEAAGGALGLASQFTLTPEFITPESFDSSVNLAPLLKERGGNVRALVWTGWGPAVGEDLLVFDGDPETAFLGDGDWGGDYSVIKNKTFIFDLGGSFLLDRIRFFPREKHFEDRFVEAFRLGLSDGDPLKDGTREFVLGHRTGFFDFDILADVQENTDAIVELRPPPTPVTSIGFELPENRRGIWEIAELEIYAFGVAPVADFVCDVIDLGEPASLGTLQWGGRSSKGVEVDLTMRAGDDEDPNNYWRFTFRGDERSRYDANGRELTRSAYNGLERAEKAGITHDTESWDFWSAAYDFDSGGGTMAANRPRQFVQLHTEVRSRETETAQLDWVQFSVSIPPVASQVMAEISPTTSAAGAVTPFTYRVRPILQPDDLGFDSVTIRTPTQPSSIDGVRVAGRDVGVDVVHVDDGGFTVRIPRFDLSQSGELVEVDFQSEVFQFGTVFEGSVFDSNRPHEVHQALTPGDADPLADGDGLQVDLDSFEEEVIRQVSLSTRVVTPNNDGINDQVMIEYDLINLTPGVPVVVSVRDLSGRVVFRDGDGRGGSGRFTTTWDGADTSGEPLAPGVYTVEVELVSDRGTERSLRSLSVAY
ncbi:MAG: FlgD immunoglobulin-like domain containing protein [Candidatus Latescibacterota bacterium]|nr:FlgD immunoglobulin-like domain containing protein [Candidatus Latescibacterota bacterium]